MLSLFKRVVSCEYTLSNKISWKFCETKLQARVGYEKQRRDELEC